MQDKFDAIVLHAVSFLRGQINLGQMPVPVLPVPWDRYLPLVNVYSVFQPSRQSGASYPLDAYGNGGHPTKGVVLTDNNLNCAYGVAPSSSTVFPHLPARECMGAVCKCCFWSAPLVAWGVGAPRALEQDGKPIMQWQLARQIP